MQRAIYFAIAVLVVLPVPPVQGQWDESDNLVLDSLEQYRLTEDPEGLAILGRYQESAGRSAEAVATYQKLVAIAPETAWAHASLARLHFDNKSVRLAIEHAEYSLRLDPDQEEMLEIIAKSYLEGGRTLDGIAWLEKFKKANARSADAAYLLSVLHGSAGHEHDAVLSLQEAVLLDSTNIFYRARFGEFLWNAKRLEEAEVHYRRAYEISEGNPRILVALARLYGQMGRRQDAAALWEDALARDIRPKEARRRLFYIYRDQGEYETAFEHANGFLALSPGEPDFLEEVGDLYRELGMPEQAMRSYGLAWKADPEHVGFAYKGVETALENDMHDVATALLRRILNQNKADLWAWTKLSYALDQSGENDRAELARQAAARLDEGGVNHLLLLGDAYASGGRDKEAIRFLNGAYDRGARAPAFLFSKGILEERMGNYDNAASTLIELIRIDPQHAPGLNFLGYMYAEQGIKLDEAEALISLALSMEPENPYFRDSLGWVYYQRGEYDQAVVELERATGGKYEDPIIVEHLADAYVAAGFREKARETYAELLSLTNRPEVVRKKLKSLDESID
ncbi:MAG: tetratricopeptide repeat protein [Gemmatimonadetes bacterium]|nr:tetratricopeptide repeat protein [Gemmatimonadota bacterium]